MYKTYAAIAACHMCLHLRLAQAAPLSSLQLMWLSWQIKSMPYKYCTSSLIQTLLSALELHQIMPCGLRACF